MKKISLLLLSLVFCFAAFSQKEAQYAGNYQPTESNGDPQGFLNLILTPDHIYAFAFFGGIEIGVWEAFDDYMILHPDTSASEFVYMFAQYNEKLKDEVSIQFDNFTDNKAIYSFDNENNTSIMHPVFNSFPNCLDYPYKISLKPGEHKNIQLVSFADLWASQYPEDSITHIVYTFPLDNRYNDFKLLLNNEKSIFKAIIKSPMVATWKDGILSIGRDSFMKIHEISEMDSEDLCWLEQLSASINHPITHRSFGDRDEYGDWEETVYPLIPYVKKEIKTVSFDTENLFNAFCE